MTNIFFYLFFYVINYRIIQSTSPTYTHADAYICAHDLAHTNGRSQTHINMQVRTHAYTLTRAHAHARLYFSCVPSGVKRTLSLWRPTGGKETSEYTTHLNKTLETLPASEQRPFLSKNSVYGQFERILMIKLSLKWRVSIHLFIQFTTL